MWLAMSVSVLTSVNVTVISSTHSFHFIWLIDFIHPSLTHAQRLLATRVRVSYCQVEIQQLFFLFTLSYHSENVVVVYFSDWVWAPAATMGYDIGWIIPRMRNPGRLWSCASSITVAVVGLFSKIILGAYLPSPGCPLENHLTKTIPVVCSSKHAIF